MMETLENQSRKLRHPFYKIMELEHDELKKELQLWERSKLIEWLSWNDKNGVYDDVESMREFGNILEKDDAINIILNQILDSN